MTDQDSLIEAHCPRCPRPPQHLIDAALRALPEALCNHARPFCGHQDTYVELFDGVSICLSDAGHNSMAADWAVFEALKAGLLTIDEQQKHETRDGWLWLRTTPALWGFWRESSTPPGDTEVNDDWILASKALARLEFIKGSYRGLKKFAAENPGRLRLRPHPNHARRLQVHAADVLRLETDHESDQFDAMDESEADDLPPITEKDVRKIAERAAQIRQSAHKSSRR